MQVRRILAVLLGALLSKFAVSTPASSQQPYIDPYYAHRENWRTADNPSVEVSHFAYHDLNRNGIFDVGDRPMASVAMTLSSPDGTQTTQRSNTNGFVNFLKSGTASPARESAAGEYSVTAHVPNGWVL